MSTDIRGQLAALINHLNAYPHLGDTLNGISHFRPNVVVQPYPFDRDSDDKLGVLADWSRTLTNCTTVTVKSIDSDGTPHLRVDGELVDGSPITVFCLPGEHQVDLLAANTPIVKGATFDVDLLLRLTSAPAAEAVTR